MVKYIFYIGKTSLTADSSQIKVDTTNITVDANVWEPGVYGWIEI